MRIDEGRRRENRLTTKRIKKNASNVNKNQEVEKGQENICNVVSCLR